MSDAQRDPFGRPVEEPGFAAPASAALTSPAPPRPAERARPPRGVPGAALAALFVVLAFAALALVLWQTDRHELDSPVVLARDLDGHALSAHSLVRAANLAAALKAVSGDLAADEQVVGLRLTPVELSTRVRDDHGQVRLVDVDLAGQLHSTDWATDTTSTPIDLAAIDATAPQRIVRAALARAHADDTHLHALSLNASAEGASTWSMTLDDVRIGDQTWIADLAGVAVTHPGELPAASGLSGRSLLATAPLRAALARVAKVGGSLTQLRIQPDRLDATVPIAGGPRDVMVDAAQRVTTRETGGGSIDEERLAVTRIDPAGLHRAVAAVVARAGVAPARLTYATLQNLPVGIDRRRWTWLIVLDRRVPAARRTWRASLDGQSVRPQ
jgi:hypothetical protein